jgi:hypothetical protein
MSGEAYAGWGNDDEYAWEFGAIELNLTIIGDYVPTTTSTTTTEVPVTKTTSKTTTI